LKVGDTVYGDRANVFTGLPENLLGAEWLRVAANARTLQSDTVRFTANEDIFVYVGIDARRNAEDLPWLMGADSAWESTDFVVTATDQTAPDGPGISYTLYRVELAKDETILLGTNGPSGSVIMYTVFFEEAVRDDEPVEFIERSGAVTHCPDCDDVEKSWRVTTIGLRHSNGDEVIISRRRAAKRDSSGRLLEACEHSFGWES